MKLLSNIKKLMNASHKKKVIFSLISAFVLTVTCYFVNNASVFTGESLTQYTIIQYVCDKIGIHKEVNYEDVFFFNNSYDKTLIPAYKGEYEATRKIIGYNVITDRHKLLKLLSFLKETDRYKYVIVDIIFDKCDVTEYDDSLVNVIGSMRDVICADCEQSLPYGESLLKERGLSQKVAKAYFLITPLKTYFSRYQFSYDEGPSIPLCLYNDLNVENGTIKRYGFSPFNFYLDKGRLCQNALFLTFNTRSIREINNLDDEFNGSFFADIEYENIGEFLDRLNCAPDYELQKTMFSNRTDGKIVFIGDLKGTDDCHDTYVGPKTGGEILLRAFQSLEEKKHIVNPFLTALWFVVFACISYVILFNHDRCFQNYILIKFRFIRFLISIISNSIILFICSLVEYVLFDRVYSIIVPIVYFACLKLVIHFRTFDKQS